MYWFEYDNKLNLVSSSNFQIFKFVFWWRITDSNRWPSACKADALASWANPPKYFLFYIFYFLLSLLKSKIKNQKSKICDCSPAQSWTADPYIISVVL